MAPRCSPSPMPPGAPLLEVASLSERTECAEAAIRELTTSLDARLAAAAASLPVNHDAMCVLTAAKYHLIPQGGLELPRPCWATLCGWRFGFSLNAEQALLSENKVAAAGKPLCDRCARRRAFGSGV